MRRKSGRRREGVKGLDNGVAVASLGFASDLREDAVTCCVWDRSWGHCVCVCVRVCKCRTCK